MYEQFWGLNGKPFDNRYDEKMLFPSASHQSAESKLRYVLESRLPAALVTGGAGVGKTALLRCIEERYRGDIVSHQLQFPQLPPAQLLACLASRLSHHPVDTNQSIADSLRCIEEQLIQAEADNQHACVVVDECHVMPSESFETLRLLLNLAEPSGTRLTLLLAGQPNVRKALQYQPQFEERLAARINLAKFDADETAQYVSHRMQTAGATRPVFSPPALEAIYQTTLGVAGRINRLCDMALLVGFADDLAVLNEEHIRNVDQGLFTMPWAA